MRLRDLVQVDKRFEKSVNLLLDLNDASRLQDYIPTRSSVNLLREYINGVISYSGGRANCLIAPYGKGKSHLLLVLVSILSGKKSDSLDELIDRISKIDNDSAKVIKDVNSTFKFLPVIINTTSGNLSQAFIRSLSQALKREQISDIMPESYFSEALSTIQQWKNVYPSTYLSLSDLLDYSVDELIRKLELFDYKALEDFRRVHPLITSGSEFNPIIDDEAISVYSSVNRLLCEKYGYSGIYIIFDEFSKYIEGHVEEGFSTDMKLLQDISELCNSSKDEQMHLTCVAHKAIRSYRDSLPKAVMDAYRGVEGRLVETTFSVSAQNNYELISDVIHKKNIFYQWKHNDVFLYMKDISYSIPEFSALFEKNDYDAIVADGCFPLTPLSALLLVNLSERIAQNERTIFTFLSGNDLHSMSTYIEIAEDSSYIGASLIYDYFEPLLESEINSQIHSEWLKAEYALSKVDTDNEKKLIKSLAVIRMVNRPDDIPANADCIRIASGIEETSFENAIELLVNNSIISYKKKTATYVFQDRISINIENEIADISVKYYKDVNVPEVLNDVCRKRYILPKKYNHTNYITRYYRKLFMSYESFIALDSAEYIEDDNQSDGFLIIVNAKDEKEKDQLKEHLYEIGDTRIVLGVVEEECPLIEEARTLLAVRKLISNEEFISENEILLAELNLIESELIEELNNWTLKIEEKIDCLYTESEPIEVGKYGINRAVSDYCDRIFIFSPIINNELINRQSVSAQIYKVRNNIMEDILWSRPMDKYLKGTSAESTIYRALLVHTEKDVNLHLVNKKIEDFIRESKGKKAPFSNLVNTLLRDPYGLRRGPMAVYIMKQLAELEDTPVVYQEKVELSISGPVIANVVRKPEDYYLFVEVETVKKLEYIEGLEGLFSEYSSSCREIGDRNRISRLTCMMQSWYRSLPRTSVTFCIEDYSDQNVRQIESFRKLFSGHVNPRETIFERIPKIVGTTDFETVLRIVESLKDDIDNHIHRLKERAIGYLRESLSIDKESNLLLNIRQWVSNLSDAVKQGVFSSNSQRLFNSLKNLDVQDSEEISEILSKETTGFFIEDWSDSTIDDFKASLQAMIGEILEKDTRSTESYNEKITIGTQNESKEFFYDFDPDNMSTSGYFFQNALDDMLDEFGESLENSEKIGILVQAIKQLMG